MASLAKEGTPMTTPNPKPAPTPKRAPRTPRIKADSHKEDLRILSPDELARAVVHGFGVRKVKRAG